VTKPHLMFNRRYGRWVVIASDPEHPNSPYLKLAKWFDTWTDAIRWLHRGTR
jgi:hypothetical protein